MGFDKQDIEIEVGGDDPNKPPPKGPRSRRFRISTRDIALLLAFILIVAGLIMGSVNMQWAIMALLLVAGGEGVSQYLHLKR